VGRVADGPRFVRQEVALSVFESEAVGSRVDTPAVSTVETERGLHETAFRHRHFTSSYGDSLIGRREVSEVFAQERAVMVMAGVSV
jgi:hypothetical protein